MLYLFYNQKTTSVIFFFLKKRCHSSNAGPGRESQVLSPNLYFAMNKPYFVHHKETMSSVFSSDYIRAAFSERSGNRRQARQLLSCYQPQSTHYQACQSRGDRKITTDWSGSLGTTYASLLPNASFHTVVSLSFTGISQGPPTGWVFRALPI